MNRILNNSSNTPGWIFGAIVFITGILNLFLVHPVPGFAYFILSCFYLPPVTSFLKERLGFSMPLPAKLILGIVIVMFTLGVSDLGDMIDKL